MSSLFVKSSVFTAVFEYVYFTDRLIWTFSYSTSNIYFILIYIYFYKVLTEFGVMILYKRKIYTFT